MNKAVNQSRIVFMFVFIPMFVLILIGFSVPDTVYVDEKILIIFMPFFVIAASLQYLENSIGIILLALIPFLQNLAYALAVAAALRRGRLMRTIILIAIVHCIAIAVSVGLLRHGDLI